MDETTLAATIGRSLRRAVRVVSLGSAVIAGIALVFIMSAVVTDVISRNVRGRSIPGLVDQTEVVLALVVFLALAYTQTRREHVAVEAVVNRLKGWRFRTVRVAAAVVGVVVTILLAWATTEVAISSFEVREARLGIAAVPLWPGRIAVAYGFWLLALELVTAGFEAWGEQPDQAHVYEGGPL